MINLFARLVLACAAVSCSSIAVAAVINFNGPLISVEEDSGTAIYSGVALNTEFSGSIDDVSFNGFITDGSTSTSFSNGPPAGGLSVGNDIVLSVEDTLFLNLIAGAPIFSVNDVVDIVDIEGDEVTASDGRIEVGLSFVLDGSAFADGSLDDYPFDPADVLLGLYFIVEENSDSDEIYLATGRNEAIVPVPAAAWLFGSGLLSLIAWRRRSLAG